MDTFHKCRVASERVSWSFAAELGELSFDFTRPFLPQRICGSQLPSWLSDADRLTLNHIRAFSYAHLFIFVEEFIIKQTCDSATAYVHADSDALSALLNFANEETKHQRMFQVAKDLISEGLNCQPGELAGRVEAARSICSKSPFAVYLLILMIEWFTQRHYIECFSEEESGLDAGFVKMFRLHWTEEAQHARLDALELEALGSSMTADEIGTAIKEFQQLLGTLGGFIVQQDELDLATFEQVTNRTLPASEREQLLRALNSESSWTFIVSGLEHKAFQTVYHKVTPDLAQTPPSLFEQVSSRLHEDSIGGDQVPPPANPPSPR